MRKFINLLPLAIGFCATLPCFSDQLQVAHRGMPAGFAIVTGENPPPSVKFAALELRDYVKKMTAVELPFTMVLT